MLIFHSILLGILQGLTEFLPVSSSGHLVIAQSILPGFTQPGVFFDVILHLGTLFAVVVYFRKQILKLSRKYLMLLIVGTIPAAVLGFLFQDFFERLFLERQLVGFALIVTALMNFLTDKVKAKKSGISNSQSFFVGIAQAIAIVPGISRSGSTIFAATGLGIKKRQAAEFSFLLSLPAVAGANMLQLSKYHGEIDSNLNIYLVGFIFAFVFGVLSIHLVLKFLLKSKFKYFGWYCLFVGILGIFL